MKDSDSKLEGAETKTNNNGTSAAQEQQDCSVTIIEQPSEKTMADDLANVEMPKPVINAGTQLLGKESKPVDQLQGKIETLLCACDGQWWAFCCLSGWCPGLAGLLLSKRLHGELTASGIMMLVGMLVTWGVVVMIVLDFPSSFFASILFNAVLIFLILLYMHQRNSFLLYQKQNQALPDEEGACTTCMIVWCLNPCNHGQIGSATGKLSHTHHTVQTV